MPPPPLSSHSSSPSLSPPSSSLTTTGPACAIGDNSTAGTTNLKNTTPSTSTIRTRTDNNCSSSSVLVFNKMVNKDTAVVTAFRRVSKYQKGQILALASAFLFSTAACLCLSYVHYVMAPDCILFAQWTGNITVGTNVDDPSKKDQQVSSIFQLKSGETHWGSKRQCMLTQYGFAAAAVASFILCWFFVFFRPTKEAYFFRKKTAASKLIIPGILFAFAFTICVLVATITLQMGFVSWCGSVTKLSGFSSCSAIESYILRQDSPFKVIDANYYSSLAAGQVFAWFGALAWIANFAILVARCYLHIDFPDYFFLEHSNGGSGTSGSSFS